MRVLARHAVLAGVLALSGCGQVDGTTAQTFAAQPENRPYDARALFNQPIPRDAATDPRSDAVIGELRRNIRGRALTATADGETPPVHTVGPRDRPYRVSVGGRTISFRVPSDARPASGTDHPLVLLDPDHPTFGREVELRIWRAEVDHDARRLTGQGLGLFKYNNDGQRLSPDGSRSLSRPFLGNGTGSGLSYLAGMIRPESVAAGEIRHAIRFAYACNDSSSRFRAPATRTDQPHPSCEDGVRRAPSGARMDMGMRLQLDPAVRCDRRRAPAPPGRESTARETRYLRIVCRTLQRYGMVVMDGTGADGLVIYMENDLTARWSPLVGEQRFGSYGWIFRDRTSPDDGLARDALTGIPWHRMRVVAPLR